MKFKIKDHPVEEEKIISLNQCSNGDIDVLLDGCVIAYFSQSKGVLVTSERWLRDKGLSLKIEE